MRRVSSDHAVRNWVYIERVGIDELALVCTHRISWIRLQNASPVQLVGVDWLGNGSESRLMVT